MMRFPMILPVLTCLAALVTARPVPQTCTLSNVRRVPQSSTAVSIGSILISNPCLPSTFQISSIDSSDESTAASTRASPESFFGWLHNIWNNIRNAIKNISIKITIPWNVLEDWLNKIAQGWEMQQDPNDSQTVDLIPSADDAKAGAQMIKWKAPIVVDRPPVNECGVTTAPGKPVKECP